MRTTLLLAVICYWVLSPTWDAGAAKPPQVLATLLTDKSEYQPGEVIIARLRLLNSSTTPIQIVTEDFGTISVKSLKRNGKSVKPNREAQCRPFLTRRMMYGASLKTLSPNEQASIVLPISVINGVRQLSLAELATKDKDGNSYKCYVYDLSRPGDYSFSVRYQWHSLKPKSVVSTTASFRVN